MDVCGDNSRTGVEECDGSALPTCEDFDLVSGVLTCNVDCTANLTACIAPQCGNNTVEGTEVCDGTALPDDCTDHGFAGGTIACLGNCTGYDTSGCTAAVCGNNIVEGNEYCDGSLDPTDTCESWGFAGGTLTCSTDCQQYDVGSCTGSGVCDHDVCAEGGPLDVNVCADTCVRDLCNYDPQCCGGTWDAICVDEVADACAGRTC
jgi:hypothetical protein